MFFFFLSLVISIGIFNLKPSPQMPERNQKDEKNQYPGHSHQTNFIELMGE
jgi:hypothetical protein